MGILRKGLMVAVLAVAVVAVAVPAQAVVFTTLFDFDNNHTGNMFDVTTFGNNITITGLEVSLIANITTGIDVYVKAGTYDGFEENAAAWTLVSSTAAVASAGVNAPTFVDVSDFTLAGGTLYGMYVTATDRAAMNYTNTGQNGALATYSNADLQLDMGAGIGHPHFNEVFEPRTWNGSLIYNVGDPIPEPGTLALFGFGLAAGAGAVRRKFGKK